MNYYKRHLGDYAKDTKTLSVYEHGVYAILLDEYYTQEKPVSDADASDLIRPTNELERASLNKVLSKYFKRDGDLWRHTYADEVVVAYQEKAEKNRTNGPKGGRPKTNTPQVGSEAKPSNNHHGYETETIQEPKEEPKHNLSHKPLAISHKEEAPIVPDGDFLAQAVIDVYHEALPKCARINVLNPKRVKRIREVDKLARKVCAEQGWEYHTPDFWGAFFAECANDAWMRGEVPRPGSPHWKQNLDVLIREDRFASVMDRAISAAKDVA